MKGTVYIDLEEWSFPLELEMIFSDKTSPTGGNVLTIHMLHSLSDLFQKTERVGKAIAMGATVTIRIPGEAIVFFAEDKKIKFPLNTPSFFRQKGEVE